MIRDYHGNEEVCLLVLIVDGCTTPDINVFTGRECIKGAREVMMYDLDEIAEQHEPKARRVIPNPPGVSESVQLTEWHPSIKCVRPTPPGWVEVYTIKNAWAGISWRPIFTGSPHHVRGNVTWQDEPITGEIIFASKAGTTRGPIKHGHYEILATDGMKQVRLTGKTSKGLSLPARHNTKSKLRFEVEPHDKNVFDIALPLK